jgi:hypothetical protein
LKKNIQGLEQWLMPRIPTTREVEIRRIQVQGQHQQKVTEIHPYINQ